MPPRAADKAYTRIQAAWLRRRRSSINEPIASTPSAMTGMTKRAFGIVPPHSRRGWMVPPPLVNLDHLSRPDRSCLAPDPPRESDEIASQGHAAQDVPGRRRSDADFQDVQEAISQATNR
jgi:hypothetical protein